jgi:beta-aspartyl-peptidase (threonine type)
MKTNKIAIAVHGGAGPDSEYIKKNIAGYQHGIEAAIQQGYNKLLEGCSALDAVEAAVNYLEDNSLFNAGRGSALNEKAEVEMGASIMYGKDRGSGGVAIVRQVKNPVTLARAVMEQTKHIYLGDMGALEFAKQINLELRPEAYFITEYNYEQYQAAAEEEGGSEKEAALIQLKRKGHGTVGAVALDIEGNVAAATSTGGLENKKEGRIADSSMIGIGTYANNDTCAVSTTGDGEYLIQHVSAFHISALMEYKGLSLEEACYYFLHQKCAHVKGDMGLIAIDPAGNISVKFNSERMHRGWKSSYEEAQIFIYP